MLDCMPVHKQEVPAKSWAKGRSGWIEVRRIMLMLYERKIRHWPRAPGSQVHLHLWSRRAGKGETAPVIIEFGDGDLDAVIRLLQEARESLTKGPGCGP